MTDTGPTDTTPPDLPVESARMRRQISIVWVVPILALLIALGVTYQQFSQRGPLIHVSFTDASGIQANETELRFRDIRVGLVEHVDFSSDLSEVIVSIRVHKDIARYLDPDAQFWVVRPEVTAQGVSGLDTVLSGVYIQGFWDNDTNDVVYTFTGLEEAPLLKAGEAGVTFEMYSDKHMPSAHTPIFYKGVQVGRLNKARINATGSRVEAEAVILDPYDKLVTSSTRFWNVSGFSFRLDPGGAQLDFTSIASLLSGGVTFETMASGGLPLSNNMTFQLHPDEESAREDFYLDGDGQAVDLMMIFDQNPPGLVAGAAVELGGLKIGEVQAINGLVDVARFGDSNVRLVATMRVNPGRLGLGEDANEGVLLDFLDLRVAAGMRGRLTNASILTGGLKIELVQLEDPPDGRLDRTAEPFPSVPTAPSDITDVTATAQGLLARAADLPIEDLMASAIGFLNSIRQFVDSDAMKAVPDDLSGTLEAIRNVASSEAIQELPDQVSGVATEVRGLISRVDAILASLDEDELVDKLVAAIDSIRKTADTLPGLVEDARGLLEEARDLALPELVSRADGLLASAEDLLNQESTQAIPSEVVRAIEDLRATLRSVDEVVESTEIKELTAELAQASARLNGILGQIETDGVVGQVSSTLSSIDQAAARLPGLTDEAKALIAEARALPLQDLATRVTDLVSSIQSVVDQTSTQAIPGEITTTLEELRSTIASVQSVVEGPDVATVTQQLADASTRITALLTQIEDEGVVANVSSTLASIDKAAQSLPPLTEDARALIEKARALPLEELTARITDLINATDAVIDQDATRALPTEISQVLSEMRDTLGEVQRLASGEDLQSLPTRVVELTDDLKSVTDRVNSILATLDEQDAAQKITDAIDSVKTAADGLPVIVAQAQDVLREAEGLPLTDLAEKATALLDSAREILDQPSTRALPAELDATLSSLRITLDEFRAGGVVQNTNATLASARQAAQAIAEASASLPALSERVSRLAVQASATLAGYDRTSEFSRDLLTALRQVSDAAASINRLARQIERNPNSLIFGR